MSLTVSLPTQEYVEQAPFNMPATYEETSPQTPTFFVFFLGVDPRRGLKIWEGTRDFRSEGTFCNISMGQGQEKPAEAIVERYAKNGGGSCCRTVTLMSSWVPSLERLLEVVQEGAHADFRCYISVRRRLERSVVLICPKVAITSCIKVANEAPPTSKVT